MIVEFYLILRTTFSYRPNHDRLTFDGKLHKDTKPNKITALQRSPSMYQNSMNEKLTQNGGSAKNDYLNLGIDLFEDELDDKSMFTVLNIFDIYIYIHVWF